MEILHWADIDSTNTMAKQLVCEGRTTAALLVAESQSSGRGQQNRCFNSPNGGLYFTILDRSRVPDRLLPCVTLAVGVACAEVIESVSLLDVSLKWPNDLYVDGKKLGGILCESIRQKSDSVWVMLGVGININTKISHLPEDIRASLTTLHEQTGKNFDLQAILAALVENIANKIELLREDVELLIAQWQKRDYLYGCQVQYYNGKDYRTALGKGMVNGGRYLIEYPDKTLEEVFSGRLQLLYR
ncbi:biotin--[acetyl-CoA-carboxylase] ligase [Desulfogranum japonicum]|uniref:biotin--[acetyl-CoA-carboxylase] ligase n=1 Tax=Desulfogranum japonicum TaxID=231447 RepID=UPI00041CB76C|nr:biotin--[acetyl-CoA-carboxylase] ligase [Desulfogranum japonicum]